MDVALCCNIVYKYVRSNFQDVASKGLRRQTYVFYHGRNRSMTARPLSSEHWHTLKAQSRIRTVFFDTNGSTYGKQSTNNQDVKICFEDLSLAFS